MIKGKMIGDIDLDSLSLSTWTNQFEKYFKTKTFEQISLLLFDFSISYPTDEQDVHVRQKKLLYNIMFLRDSQSQEDACVAWSEYIKLTFQLNFPNRKLQLQRLVNKALEFLSEQTLKTFKPFVDIHLMAASLKSTDKETQRYFQNVLSKKEIGMKFSDL